MQLTSFGKTDVGRKRQKNEDSLLLETDLALFVVADGMGGHVGGAVASKIAVETVREVIGMLTEDPDTTLQNISELKPGDNEGYLRYAIQAASEQIFQKATRDNSLSGMGTTTVTALFREGRAYIANVGDSRCYRLRGGIFEQLTEDHSLVGEQLRAGILGPEEAKDHRLKNVITRSVGYQDAIDVDTLVSPLKEGDIFLLCSDGLYNLVADAEMHDILNHHDLKNACGHLIDIANSRGGDDNISVILVRVESQEGDKEDEVTIQM